MRISMKLTEHSADEDQLDDVTFFLKSPLIPTISKEETIMEVEIWKMKKDDIEKIEGF